MLLMVLLEHFLIMAVDLDVIMAVDN
jgi:hypothetical protein